MVSSLEEEHAKTAKVIGANFWVLKFQDHHYYYYLKGIHSRDRAENDPFTII